MWLYTKAAIIACLSILLIVGGWKAATWRLEAQAAEVLRVELRNELQRRVAEQVKAAAADRARLAAETALQAKEAAIANNVKTVKQTIVKYVKSDNPACDLPDPVASQLQRLREGGEQPIMPAANP